MVMFICLTIFLLFFVIYMVAAWNITPKYKKREFICSCEVVPIIGNVYAIKTHKNKILCKYVDFEDEDKVKIDVIEIKTDIVKISEDEKPTFYLYEQKLKNRWLHPGYNNKYIGVLSIPEGSVLDEYDK